MYVCVRACVCACVCVWVYVRVYVCVLKRHQRQPVLPIKNKPIKKQADSPSNTSYKYVALVLNQYTATKPGKANKLCEHKQRRSHCRECGGSSLCDRQRRRSTCKACHGSSICEHNRRRNNCKDCRGCSLCEHQRRKTECKVCGGSGLCEHQQRRNDCKACSGSSICKHQRRRRKCKDCREAKDKQAQQQKEMEKEKSVPVSTRDDRSLGQGRAGVKEMEEEKESIPPGEAWVGCTFRKKFATKCLGYAMFEGRIVKYLQSDNLYTIQYDDGNEEELEECEVSALLYPKTRVQKEQRADCPSQSAVYSASSQGIVMAMVARRHEPENQGTGIEEAARSWATNTRSPAALITASSSLDHEDEQGSGNRAVGGAGGAGALVQDEMEEADKAAGRVGCSSSSRAVADAEEESGKTFQAEEREESAEAAEEQKGGVRKEKMEEERKRRKKKNVVQRARRTNAARWEAKTGGGGRNS